MNQSYPKCNQNQDNKVFKTYTFAGLEVCTEALESITRNHIECNLKTGARMAKYEQ